MDMENLRLVDIRTRELLCLRKADTAFESLQLGKACHLPRRIADIQATYQVPWNYGYGPILSSVMVPDFPCFEC